MARCRSREAGDGVDSGRRQLRRRGVTGGLRRRAPRAARRGCGDPQLPARRVRVLLASRAHARVAAEGVGQPGHPRSDCRAAVGAGEHRALRRRPEERHDLRRVSRLAGRQRADDVAAVERAVSSRDRRERRGRTGWGAVDTRRSREARAGRRLPLEGSGRGITR